MPEITSYTAENKTKQKSLRDSATSIPFASKVAESNIGADAGYTPGEFQKNVLVSILNRQHPLIHAWLVLSSVSICFLTALFFIFQ